MAYILQSHAQGGPQRGVSVRPYPPSSLRAHLPQRRMMDCHGVGRERISRFLFTVSTPSTFRQRHVSHHKGPQFGQLRSF
jgi:hypothetical protein